jgi:hypothetical protein
MTTKESADNFRQSIKEDWLNRLQTALNGSLYPVFLKQCITNKHLPVGYKTYIVWENLSVPGVKSVHELFRFPLHLGKKEVVELCNQHNAKFK